MAINRVTEQKQIQAPSAASGEVLNLSDKMPKSAPLFEQASKPILDYVSGLDRVKLNVKLQEDYYNQVQTAEDAYTVYAAGMNQLNAGLQDALQKGENIYEYKKKYERTAKELQAEFDNSLSKLNNNSIFNKYKQQANDFNLKNSYNFQIQFTQADYKLKSESKQAYIATTDDETLKSLDGITDASKVSSIISNYLDTNRSFQLHNLYKELQGLPNEVARQKIAESNAKFIQSAADYIAQQEQFKPNFKGYDNVYKFLNDSSINNYFTNQASRNALFSKYEQEDLTTKNALGLIGNDIDSIFKTINNVGKHMTPKEKAQFIASFIKSSSGPGDKPTALDNVEFGKAYQNRLRQNFEPTAFLYVGSGDSVNSVVDWENVLDGEISIKGDKNGTTTKNARNMGLGRAALASAKLNELVQSNTAENGKLPATEEFIAKQYENAHNFITAKLNDYQNRFFKYANPDTSVPTNWPTIKKWWSFTQAPTVLETIANDFMQAVTDSEGKVDVDDFIALTSAMYNDKDIQKLLQSEIKNISSNDINTIVNKEVFYLSSLETNVRYRGTGIFSQIGSDKISLYDRVSEFYGGYAGGGKRNVLIKMQEVDAAGRARYIGSTKRYTDEYIQQLNQEAANNGIPFYIDPVSSLATKPESLNFGKDFLQYHYDNIILVNQNNATNNTTVPVFGLNFNVTPQDSMYAGNVNKYNQNYKEFSDDTKFYEGVYSQFSDGKLSLNSAVDKIKKYQQNKDFIKTRSSSVGLVSKEDTDWVRREYEQWKKYKEQVLSNRNKGVK